jgi:hypothetical protein
MQSVNDAALLRCPRCVSDLVGRRYKQARRGGESKVEEIGPFALKQRDREFESISLHHPVHQFWYLLENRRKSAQYAVSRAQVNRLCGFSARSGETARACGFICVTRGTGEKHFPAFRAQDARFRFESRFSSCCSGS